MLQRLTTETRRTATEETSFSPTPLRDLSVFAPYLRAGLEFFTVESFALALDYKAQFFLGDDDAGQPVDGGASQVSVLCSWYW